MLKYNDNSRFIAIKRNMGSKMGSLGQERNINTKTPRLKVRED